MSDMHAPSVGACLPANPFPNPAGLKSLHSGPAITNHC